MTKENIQKWWNENNKKDIKDILKDKKGSEDIYNGIINIIDMWVNFDRKIKVKGNMNIYALVTTIILSINAIIVLQFNIIKEYLYKQLNYNISLFIVLIVMNLIIVWIIYTYKKLSQNK